MGQRIVETPIARLRDPEGSHRGAAQVTASGRRAAQQAATADAVKKHPGSTSLELARKTGIDRYVLGRRLSECVTAGTVKRGADRKCIESGITVTTWWPA